jgi:Ni,Fe-hydrogenase III small subunit
MLVLLRQLARVRRQADLDRARGWRSVDIRHVDAGSCNGCEHELGLATSPFYDMQRFGLDVVASPRHADVLLVTGPVTTRMATALRVAYGAMPEPRLVAALGDCALGCGILGHRGELVGALEEVLAVDVRIPGCPPTPQLIAEHLLAGLDGL